MNDVTMQSIAREMNISETAFVSVNKTEDIASGTGFCCLYLLLFNMCWTMQIRYTSTFWWWTWNRRVILFHLEFMGHKWWRLGSNVICQNIFDQPLNITVLQFMRSLLAVTILAYRFGLRWFTPTNEVDLCGHATLSSAAVLFYHYGNTNSLLEFDTMSGILTAERRDNLITLDLPLADVSTQVFTCCSK